MCSFIVGLGFKVLVPVEIFTVICNYALTIAGPVISALHISVVGSTLTSVEDGVPEDCSWGGGVKVQRYGLSVLLDESLGQCLEPARSQSPYGLLSVMSSTG